MHNDALIKDLAGCASAETLLAAILQHHPDLQAPVPVENIARSVGISACRDMAVEGATSGVTPDPERPKAGIILRAPDLTAQRQRFAIAHQLGHFLLAHAPSGQQNGERHCTTRDLNENRRDTPHRKAEMQANRFAAGLLMPKPLFTPFVERLGKPTIAHLPLIAAAFDVSLDAAAGRYVDLTPATCALLFVRKGLVRYARSSRSFPPLSVQPGAPTPSPVAMADTKDKIVWEPTEARDWLVMSRDVRPPKLSMQISGKSGGLQCVMLLINAAAERRADEEAEKFATERVKFGR